MLISRRALVRSAALLGGSGAAGLSYAFGLEPRWLDLMRHTIPTRWLARGARLRILHLSDLHASPPVPFSRIEAALAAGLAEKPDLICLTGDYVTTDTECDFKVYSLVLSVLPKAAPTFATVGNHDGGKWSATRHGLRSSEKVRGMLGEAGINVLQNQSAAPEIAGTRLQVVGLADFWTREFDSRKAFDGLAKQADCLRIVLSHNPDTKAILQHYSWELMLSGHTHGGQVVIPLIGPPILPVNDTAFYQGLHTWQGRRLYITRGVGGVLGGVRFNCRPEVTILDLVGGTSPTELTESKPRA
jgi:predicted MPP superfamily phosphohydrolase